MTISPRGQEFGGAVSPQEYRDINVGRFNDIKGSFNLYSEAREFTPQLTGIEKIRTIPTANKSGATVMVEYRDATGRLRTASFGINDHAAELMGQVPTDLSGIDLKDIFESTLEGLEEQKQLLEDHKRILRGKVQMIPKNTVFPSQLSGVDRLSVFPDPAVSGQVMVSGRYRSPRTGKEQGISLQISGDGKVLGSLPDDLAGVRKEDVYRELLDNLDALGLTHIEIIDDVLLPAGVQTQPKGTGGPDSGPAWVDPRRFALLQAEANHLFTAVSRMSGFEGYRVFVFRKHAMLEHPVTKNAMYIIDFDQQEQQQVEQIIGQRGAGELSSADRQAIISLPWMRQAKKTKGDLRQLIQRGVPGISLIEHRGDWEAEIRNALFQRV